MTGFVAEDIFSDDNIPPEAPLESDCCNSGCVSCVFDVYERQLSKWKNKELLRNRLDQIRYDLLSETRFKPFVLLKKTTIVPGVYYLLRFQPKLGNDCVLICSDGVEQMIPGVLPCAPGMHFIMKTDDDCSKQCLECVSDPSEPGNNTSRNVHDGNFSDVESSPSKLSDKYVSRTGGNSFVTRAYTPITLSAKESNCCFDIVLKLYSNGRMSEHIRKLTVGSTAYFRGPCGEFCHNFNAYKRVLMLCIGTGIAPIYSVVKQILSDENNETILKLLYGCRTVEDILLRDELRDFTLYWNFTLKYFISSHVTAADSLNMKFGEHLFHGRIDEKAISEELRSMSGDNWLILVCGTDEFTQMVSNCSVHHGVNRENIHIF